MASITNSGLASVPASMILVFKNVASTSSSNNGSALFAGYSSTISVSRNMGSTTTSNIGSAPVPISGYSSTISVSGNVESTFTSNIGTASASAPTILVPNNVAPITNIGTASQQRSPTMLFLNNAASISNISTASGPVSPILIYDNFKLILKIKLMSKSQAIGVGKAPSSTSTSALRPVSSNKSIGSVSATTTFTCFHKLPLELRLMIWEVLCEARTIEVRHEIHHETLPRQKNEGYILYTPLLSHPTKHHMPIVLHISSESRTVALKHFSLGFGLPSQTHRALRKSVYNAANWIVRSNDWNWPKVRFSGHEAKTYVNWKSDLIQLNGSNYAPGKWWDYYATLGGPIKRMTMAETWEFPDLANDFLLQLEEIVLWTRHASWGDVGFKRLVFLKPDGRGRALAGDWTGSGEVKRITQHFQRKLWTKKTKIESSYTNAGAKKIPKITFAWALEHYPEMSRH